MATRVLYRPIDGPERELQFLRWDPRSLVVVRPAGMWRAGREWKIGRWQVQRWLRNGMLRLEGDRPEWAEE